MCSSIFSSDIAPKASLYILRRWCDNAVLWALSRTSMMIAKAAIIRTNTPMETLKLQVKTTALSTPRDANDTAIKPEWSSGISPFGSWQAAMVFHFSRTLTSQLEQSKRCKKTVSLHSCSSSKPLGGHCGSVDGRAGMFLLHCFSSSLISFCPDKCFHVPQLTVPAK